VEWPRGEATACKAVYTGSNPVSTSDPLMRVWAIGAVGARFLDTEEVTGSIPVSPTLFSQVRSQVRRSGTWLQDHWSADGPQIWTAFDGLGRHKSPPFGTRRALALMAPP
jgi:hypothetical protein